jgi:uncharacterized protein
MDCVLSVKVIPRSRKTGLAGRYADGIKIRIKAPPEKGEANRELIEVLADLLQLPKSNLVLVAGMTSPRKKLHIEGLIMEDVFRRLNLEV